MTDSEEPRAFTDEDWFAEVEGRFVLQKTWARISTLSHMYYNIAADAYEQYLKEAERKIPRPDDDEDYSEHIEHAHRLTVNAIKTIVFSAMALEAAIFDFAAIHLGDEMATQYLDKLDLLGKWVMVPRLVCGRPLTEKGPALNGLRTLVKARNRLVHHKSLPFSQASLIKMEKQSAQLQQDLRQALQTVILLSLELEMLTEISIGVLPNFHYETEHLQDQSQPRPRVAKVIADCRAIHRKNFR